MSSIKFKIEEYFLLKTNDKNKRIGKIEEIIENSNEKFIRYNIFYFPEDTKGGRKSHNSVNEIYSSDEIETALCSIIKQKVKVLTLDEYIKHKIPPTAKDVYFYRQKYSYEDNSYLPDLDSTCYCDKIFNPDEEYQICAKCKDYFHMSCYIESNRQKCYNELCNNIIKNQFTTIELENEKIKINRESIRLLGNKHKRNEEGVISNKDKNQKIVHYPNHYLEKYRNLPDQSRINIISLTEQIEKDHLIQSKSLSDTDKIRQNAKDTIQFALLYGIEELKNINDWSKFIRNDFGLNQSNINDVKIAIKYTEMLSKEIENCIYSINKYEISNHYRKKLRTLYTYLTHEDNCELRIAVIVKEIAPKKLVEMSSDELAPSSIIQSRLEKQNKYFKEQVLIDEAQSIITKTHKGEAVLIIEENSKPDAVAEFVPFEIIKPKIKVEELINLYSNSSMNENDKELMSPVTNQQDEKRIIENYIAFKYKTQSKTKIKYLASFEDFTKEKLKETMNKQVQLNLNIETINLLNKYREKYKKDIVI